jgi:hypothetical protein
MQTSDCGRGKPEGEEFREKRLETPILLSVVVRAEYGSVGHAGTNNSLSSLTRP